MKKLLSVIIAVIIAVLSFSTPVAGSEISVTSTNVHNEQSLFATYTTKQITDLRPGLTKSIVDGLKSLSTDIAIDEKYGITQGDIADIFKSILCENPGIFYVDPHLFEVSTTVDGIVIALRPVYLYRFSEIEERKKILDTAVSEMLSKVESKWSTVQKCRYIHDMIASHCTYFGGTSSDYSIYTAYGALVDGIAYCEGYALAFNYIMSKMGITSYYIQSVKVTHAWSLVKIDGKFFHVDIAYDDPTPATTGRVFHDYCIVSDSQMKYYDSIEDNPYKHTDWVSNIKADSDVYNNAWWRNVETAIYTVGDTDYYIDHTYGASNYGGLVAHNNATNTDTMIDKIDNRWYVKDEVGAYWKGNFTYLCYDGSYLYYNDTENVYMVSPGSANRMIFYTKPYTIPGYIYGLTTRSNGKIYMGVKDSPNDADVIYHITYNGGIVPTLPHTEDTNSTEESVDFTEETQETQTLTTEPKQGGMIVITPEVPEVKPVVYNRKLSVGSSYSIDVMGLSSSTKSYYSSSNTNVVKVTSTGKMTALKKGTATITINVIDKSDIVAVVKCKATVTKDPYLSKSTISVKKGKTTGVVLNGKAKAINNKYTNTSIAKITSSKTSSVIRVKGIKKGKTTLKVKVNGVKTLNLKVNVK